MKVHLVSGGCSFIGRNLVKRLYETTNDTILFIDDLSTGAPPSAWLDVEQVGNKEDLAIFGPEERLLFLQDDFRNWLSAMTANPDYLQEKYGLPITRISDVFHFAAIQNTPQKDNNSINVGLNLAIDAEFFAWVSQHQPERVCYASTSDIYTNASLSKEETSLGLVKSTINAKDLPTPDTLFSWSKLTGEYLAQTTAQNYGVSISCIRLFTAYGGDQGLSASIPAIAARIIRQEDPLMVMGAGQQRSDYIHITDVLDGIFKAMDSIKDGSAINIGSGQLTSLLEIIHTLCDIADYEPTIQQTLAHPTVSKTPYANLLEIKEKLDWTPKISMEEGLVDIYQTALERERAAEVV